MVKKVIISTILLLLVFFLPLLIKGQMVPVSSGPITKKNTVQQPLKGKAKQTRPDIKKISFLWYPINLLFSTYSFEFEMTIDDFWTFCGEGKYMNNKPYDRDEKWTATKLSIGPGIRYYLDGKAPEGRFIGFYINYSFHI